MCSVSVKKPPMGSGQSVIKKLGVTDSKIVRTKTKLQKHKENFYEVESRLNRKSIQVEQDFEKIDNIVSFL